MEETQSMGWKGDLDFGKQSLLMECKGLLLGAGIGLLVGLTGAAFVASLKWAEASLEQYPWMLYLLPFAGLLIVFLYRLAGNKAVGGTNLVIVGARGDGAVPQRLAPLIFVSSCLTQLFGGSAGREGAALQMGGSLAAWLSKRLHLKQELTDMAVLCGMSAGFSAVFGSQISAVVFALEISYVGALRLSAFFPCVVASVTAGTLAMELGAPVTLFRFVEMQPSLLLYGKVLILAGLCAWLSVLVCRVFQGTGVMLQKILPNAYLRILMGGCVIVALTLLCQSRAYLGTGHTLIVQTIEGGETTTWAFIWKLIFTAVTLGAGYRGGEIVPVFAIGSSFGCLLGPWLGLNASFGAAVGMIALFCSVTNCPIASLCLAFEAFGFHTPVAFLVVVSTSFLMSGYGGLYSKQKFASSKMVGSVMSESKQKKKS